MATVLNIPLTKKVLEAARAERASFGDEGAQRGDVALKGSTRRKVIAAALSSLSDNERATLKAADDATIHAWIGGVLKHAGCLLDSVEGYLKTVEEFGLTESHAPSVIGPASVRRALDAINQALAPKEPKAKEPKAKEPKGPKVKAPKAKKTPLPVKTN